jgi:hypothetical protein
MGKDAYSLVHARIQQRVDEPPVRSSQCFMERVVDPRTPVREYMRRCTVQIAREPSTVS